MLLIGNRNSNRWMHTAIHFPPTAFHPLISWNHSWSLPWAKETDEGFFPSSSSSFFLESILFISWHKSLHCGALSTMNLSFLSRAWAFQPCEKGPHCGGPKTPEFLAASKRDLWGKRRICRPDFHPRHFSLAGHGFCCLLRGVNHCAITSLREQGQNKREDFAFLSPSCCLRSVSAEQTAQLYVLLMYFCLGCSDFLCIP